MQIEAVEKSLADVGGFPAEPAFHCFNAVSKRGIVRHRKASDLINIRANRLKNEDESKKAHNFAIDKLVPRCTK